MSLVVIEKTEILAFLFSLGSFFPLFHPLNKDAERRTDPVSYVDSATKFTASFDLQWFLNFLNVGQIYNSQQRKGLTRCKSSTKIIF